ncbi:coiled-coil domain-containing protein 115-like isoform X2 [Acanthaster planci]|uniref:Vacuolar ATPase assembly protein VMA22 n=1 Tax=Acanthaster planci TaxID=133434 RepID=A0A8B7ZRC3_ACAPL|nr:coiled-coil domain-containing protein 115-like isoform X2 [Acanthaster planci]
MFKSDDTVLRKTKFESGGVSVGHAISSCSAHWRTQSMRNQLREMDMTVRQELDDLVVNYSDTLDKITEVRQRMHSTLQQGFYHLSKARISMGKEQVGTLQFDNRGMKALAYVKMSEDEDEKVCSFLLEHRQLSQVSKAKLVKSYSSSVDVRDPPVLKDKDVDSGQPPINPLQWFGVLVSPNLKQCQLNFINGV